MNLSIFIRTDMTKILADWTAFARKSAPPNATMSTLALTDHAEEILSAIADDIETYQSQRQQYDKSRGEEDENGGPESAAAIHGRLRQASNFSLLQLSAEFRALRATVLRRWLAGVDQMSPTTIYEMVRFNEAIDQALAESIATFSARADRTRDLFLAVLGHDLRAPLATISLVGDLMARQSMSPTQLSALGLKAKRGAMLMGTMVTDLLGYTRLQMGAGMPMMLALADVRQICLAAVSDATAMYPDSLIDFAAGPTLDAMVDAVRLQQLISNLLINAAQFSTQGSAITLSLAELDEHIVISVHNLGPVIPADALATIFQPLAQLNPDGGEDNRPTTSLGLGLFIAQETAAAHHGTITVRSSTADGTLFSVSLPRQRGQSEVPRSAFPGNA